MTDKNRPQACPPGDKMLHTLLVFRAPTTLSQSLGALASQRKQSVSAIIREFLIAGLTREDAHAD